MPRVAAAASQPSLQWGAPPPPDSIFAGESTWTKGVPAVAWGDTLVMALTGEGQSQDVCRNSFPLPIHHSSLYMLAHHCCM